MGLTLPSSDAQLSLVKTTYAAAGLDPVNRSRTGVSILNPKERVHVPVIHRKRRLYNAPFFLHQKPWRMTISYT